MSFRQSATTALLAAIPALAVSVSVAPPAGADCVNAGAATVCAQGEVTGGGPTAPKAGPVYPYPCEYDWYCDGGGLSIVLDPGRSDGGGIGIGGGGIGGGAGPGGGGGIRPR
ncbi:hypothetical protein [Mycolicibacterium sp.]|uniref:hypothetical protein n=1 Tax=Mycolicibacterium sp. TaxID=2320850 RepID=UPI001D78A400|nr:hypothetical protein [Mycolicibacterium sp.]MCB1292065.1 hypothetical protein [Mycobacterium sp.]MCB9409440.1 hypothetical protein [Mycolicibacterium sp.]